MSDRDAFREAREQDYIEGAADGLEGRYPEFERLAIGANRLNAYERGYIDSGEAERAGCVCCGTQDNLLWREGDHELAVATICRACKFGACEVCRGE